MKKKRLTLNRAWNLCLELWEWIAEQKETGSQLNTSQLKSLWFKENLSNESMQNDCFFCEYDERNKQEYYCDACPAKLVIKNFHCTDRRYYWDIKTIKFYEKLLWINKRRLK